MLVYEVLHSQRRSNEFRKVNHAVAMVVYFIDQVLGLAFRYSNTMLFQQNLQFLYIDHASVVFVDLGECLVQLTQSLTWLNHFN